MQTFFKRTLLGVAVSAAAISGASNAAVELNGKAVQFYGQAAGYVHLADNDKNTVSVGIESRIGFRGEVEFEDFGPDFVWQIEGANASTGNGNLGGRDTYLGFKFDEVGTFKYGRQLVASYNYVDWPHSNPGLGNVFDWNNDIDAGFQDRADNVLRFDSASFGGFNFQASLSGMEETTKNVVTSVGASFSQETFGVHGGYYSQGETDKSYGIVGGSIFLGDLTLTSAFKAMKVGEAKQNAMSATAQYVIDGKWVLKGGYAATGDASNKTDTADTAITARLGYLLPSAYLYVDSRNYKLNSADSFQKNVLAGVEYYF